MCSAWHQIYVEKMEEIWLNIMTNTIPIIRCQGTVILRRPQIKQDTALIEAGIQNQREHHIILTKYEAMHPTVILEK